MSPRPVPFTQTLARLFVPRNLDIDGFEEEENPRQDETRIRDKVLEDTKVEI